MWWKHFLLSLSAAVLLVSAAGAVDFEKIDKLPVEKRIEAYSEMLGSEKDSMRVLSRLGNAYFDAGQTEDAVRIYRRAMQAGGDRKVFLNLTYALGELGRRDEVANLYKNELEKSPKDALLRAFYADFLSEEPVETKKGIGLAVQEYQKAIELDPKCAEAYFGMGVLFARMGILKEAIREWEKVIAIDPNGRMAPQAERNIAQARQPR
jgi:tetratricopeptide (TPR) repeat protein